MNNGYDHIVKLTLKFGGPNLANSLAEQLWELGEGKIDTSIENNRAVINVNATFKGDTFEEWLLKNIRVFDNVEWQYEGEGATGFLSIRENTIMICGVQPDNKWKPMFEGGV